jgi:ABC-2 type transport system ATP-binding protein
MEVLSIKNVYKSIGQREIIKNLNLSVKSGEVMGFLGPNGAGKTTTIRMMVGLIKPTRGNIEICGYDINKDFVKAISNVGCIVENPEFYGYLSGMENLLQFGSMKKNISKEKYKEIVQLVGLSNRIYHKVSTYSLGMRQRLGLALSLVTEPKLLVLDEPTNGLDPSGIIEFRNLIKRLSKERDMGVFISSHLLSQIQQMCDSVAFIKQGTIVKTAGIKNLNNHKGFIWHVGDAPKASSLIKERLSLEPYIIDSTTLWAKANEDMLPTINSLLIQEGLDLSLIEPKEDSLEHLFLEITEGDEIA